MKCKDVGQLKSIRPKESSPVSLTDVFFANSGLCTRIVYPSADTVGWSEIFTNSLDTPTYHVIRNIVSNLGFSDRLIRFSYGSRDEMESHSAWSINLHNMSIEFYGQEVFAGLSKDREDQGTRWKIVTESVSTIYNDTAFGIHFTCSNISESIKQETDSGYGGSLSSGGSDHSNASDSDSDWDNDSGNDSDNPDEPPSNSDAQSRSESIGNMPKAHSTDCFVLLREGENPIVDSWAGGPGRSQISCSFHPSRNIVAWSRSSGEFRVLDMTTGKVSTRKIDELFGSNDFVSVIVRGMADFLRET